MIWIRSACEKGRGIELKISRVNGPFLLLAVCLLSLSIGSIGCGNKFWDPTQVGRFSPRPAFNVILDSLGVEEEGASAWAGAEEPRPVDVMVLDTDYVLNPGDVVRVSIFELLRESDMFVNDYVVTETGKISIPEVGTVDAEGLTETQLQEEIRNILSPGILKDPSVTVTLRTSQRRAFSILGQGIGAPGRYFVPRYQFRLADAIATAQGISEFNVESIYVVRGVTGRELKAAPPEPVDSGDNRQELLVPKKELLDIIKPQATGPENGVVVTSVEMSTEKDVVGGSSKYEGLGKGSVRDNGGALSEAIGRLKTQLQQDGEENGGRVEWVFRDGRWVPVQVGRPGVTPEPKVAEAEKMLEPLEEKVPSGFGWNEIGGAGVQSRVIKIPVDRFQSGDPRYNVVIRPGDTVYVPVDIVGEFYITGNVNRQGPIGLTGRPMTLKMAVAAAGGLGALAWPKRCEVIRRIGKDKEEIVMVDLDKIYSGEQPDFFIKVNDLINVGTHPTARWRAVLRNAFRASYGFGFIYDRNFADRDYWTHRPFPDWF